MILPEKKEDPNKRYYAAAVTAAVCLIFYVSLVIASVSDPDSTRVYMTEMTQLNITSFQPNIPEPEVQQQPDEPMQQEESPAETQEPEVRTPQRVQLDEILPQGVQVDLSISRTPAQPTQTQSAAQTEQRSLRMETAEMERSGLQTLTGSNLSAPSVNRRSLGGNGGLEGGLDIAEGGGLSGSRTSLSDVGGSGSLLSGPQVRDGGAQGQQVGLRDLSEFGDGYSDMDPIIHDLIRWMKENPADLPIAVRRTMTDGRWDDSLLSSRVPFFIENRQFDLLLMAKEEDLEIHIFLVEERNATYLIDRGFRGESSYLRRGNVAYHNEDIADVDSQMRQAGSAQTQEFYQIFRSWWESIDYN